MDPRDETKASWAPLVIIVLAQILLIFNVSTLQVSIESIASGFQTSATTIGTAIVTYALVVAGLIMVGSRVAQIYGARRIFRMMVLLFGAGMAGMALSPGVNSMMLAQIVAGAAAAVLVPTLVVLVSDNYKGHQQARALSWLGGAPAMGIALAFLIAGSLVTLVGWRFMFGGLAVLAVVIFRLSRRLDPVKSPSNVSIDWVGAALVASAILLVSVGSNSLTDWGVLLAGPRAPFAVMDMSPAPVLILAGIFLGQAFLTWSRRRRRVGGMPLVALEVVDTPKERAALFSIFIVSSLASAITFLVPLYIQIVQGGTSLATAVAVIPFSLASLGAALFVVRLYGRLSPSRIARLAFLLLAIGLTLLGAVIRNDWGSAMVVFSMFVAGLGEGALVTLLFNVLVTASPKLLAGDVGSVRGATNNLATAVGTALASAFVVGLLGTSVHRELVHNPRIPNELKSQFDLDRVSFVSNAQLRRQLDRAEATSEQTKEAVRINTDTRLVALKVTFFTLAGLALLAFFPAGALPGYALGAEPRASPDRIKARVEPAVPVAARHRRRDEDGPPAPGP